MLPEVEGPYAVLPPGVHSASLADVHHSFVEAAPPSTQERRRLIYRALELHLDLLQRLFRGHSWKLWIDGGFATGKKWRPPRDVDIVAIAPPDAVARAERDAALPLWTLSKVTAQRGGDGPTMATLKLHPMGGLVDAYLFDTESPFQLELMRRDLTKVKGPDGEIVQGQTKGIVEVTFNA